MQDIGFDVITDLNLSRNDSFNWENKATSLYCLVGGNISSDLYVVRQTLTHISQFYQAVFYVPGTLEYETGTSIPERLSELSYLTRHIQKVCLLHQHIAMIDGIAVIGFNGWNDANIYSEDIDFMKVLGREQEIEYFYKSLSKLQRYPDIKKIVVVTNAVPHHDLYFKETPEYAQLQIPLNECLNADTERKVSHWVFGNYKKTVDTKIDDVNYLNNPRVSNSPYYAKRITISV